jgi:hypothetical protein
MLMARGFAVKPENGLPFYLSRRERSDCEAIRVRGYGLSKDLNPSPVSHLTMRADLSLRRER